MPVTLEQAKASPPATGGEVLSAQNVSKTYGSIKVLSNVSFGVRPGEIVALVGENGAGKSTLMKIVSGIIPAGSFSGEIAVDGGKCSFSNVHDAEKHGIVLVPQELRIAPGLSVAENMFVGHLPTNRLGIVDFERLERQAAEWLSVFDLDFSPNDPAGVYSTAEQRMIVIAGALSKKANVLLLDEPTAALTDAETQQLFKHVVDLRNRGLGIVLITHRLDEVEQIADRVVVLRNGALVDAFDTARGKRNDIVKAMIGRELESSSRSQRAGTVGDVVAVLKDVRVEDPHVTGKYRVNGFDLTLKAGEIHGLYGLVGAGRTELARSLFGDWQGKVSGSVDILGVSAFPRSPREGLKLGIAMLTEDRKATGILDGHTLATNLSAASLPGLHRFGVIDEMAERQRNREMMEKLDVRPADLNYRIELLSGGNQQKVLFGRWLNCGPKILILDEPTLGVDVGARFQIYKTIERLADEGLAVLFISSDVDEVAAQCDRITVMYKGKMAWEFGHDRSREALVAAATGGMA